MSGIDARLAIHLASGILRSPQTAANANADADAVVKAVIWRLGNESRWLGVPNDDLGMA
ncbi:hypothetical protein [Bradyrhizobium ganzhouense]|uniref:hypothetical protein n=1 Tax=Bradyrhizobium ganzhouense TaxID=1179767 RepID=UPI003CFAF3AF